MSEMVKTPSVTSFSIEYERLLQLCREKDRINQQLVNKIEIQQQQIQRLIVAAEQKQQQRIKKLRYNQFKHRLLESDYLLIKLDDTISEIYLPERIHICDMNQAKRVLKDIQFTSQLNSPHKGVFQELETLKNQIGKFMEPPQLSSQDNIQDIQEEQRIKKLQQRLLKYQEQEDITDKKRQDQPPKTQLTESTVKNYNNNNGVGKSGNKSKIIRVRHD